MKFSPCSSCRSCPLPSEIIPKKSVRQRTPEGNKSAARSACHFRNSGNDTLRGVILAYLAPAMRDQQTDHNRKVSSKGGIKNADSQN